MKKEYKDKQLDKDMSVNESLTTYHYGTSSVRISRKISQAELDAECFTLQESKNKMIEKVARHYHHT